MNQFLNIRGPFQNIFNHRHRLREVSIFFSSDQMIQTIAFVLEIKLTAPGGWGAYLLVLAGYVHHGIMRLCAY